MKLREINKKTLCKMRTAVKATIVLHEKAIKEKMTYDAVEHSRALRNKLYEKGIEPTPLCAYVDDLLGVDTIDTSDCKHCPFIMIGRKRCNRNDDMDSKRMIKRLRLWMGIINAEIASRSKK